MYALNTCFKMIYQNYYNRFNFWTSENIENEDSPQFLEMFNMLDTTYILNE